MKHVALYVRVSTQEQKLHGISVDSQIDALTKYCDLHDMEIYSVYNDAGISARKSYRKRPELLRLIEDVKQGHIDLIVFTKLDRWFRSVSDYYQVQNILDQHKVPWRAIWEDYNTESSDGILKVNIMLSVAQSEADRTSERIKAVNNYRREQGKFVGRPATGYLLDNGILKIDPDKEKAVRAFFETYQNTLSTARAMEAAYNEGMFIYNNLASRMLKNEAYTGHAQNTTFPAYITEEQYRINLKSVESRKREKGTRTYFVFTGLVRCGLCGHPMTGHTHWDIVAGERKPSAQYCCQARKTRTTCKIQHSISERKIEKYLIEYYDEMLSAEHYQVKLVSKGKVDYTSKIKQLEKKLKRIGERYEDGDISREEYISKRDSVKSEIEEYKTKSNGKVLPDALPKGWKEIYAQLSPQGKRTFWMSSGIKYVEISKGKDRIKIVF